MSISKIFFTTLFDAVVETFSSFKGAQIPISTPTSFLSSNPRAGL